MAETIREFVVALGYDVNEGQERRFKEGLKQAEAAIRKVGIAAAGMTAALVTGVYRTARSMEDLYYSSQRANSAAGNMQAFGFAVGQMGGNAEAAKKSVENLAHFIRTVPGAQGMINQFLGRDAKAELGDTVKLMQDLGARFPASSPTQRTVARCGPRPRPGGRSRGRGWSSPFVFHQFAFHDVKVS